MKLRVGIITSFEQGVAAHHIERMAAEKNPQFQICGVIRVLHPPRRTAQFWKRKIKKFMKIGPLGTLNGIRIRPWFTTNVDQLLAIPSVQAVCDKHEIPLVLVNQLNSAETRLTLEKLDLDVAVSLGNGFIAPSVFTIPKEGMLNIHHEILPQFRNAQSVIWQLFHESSTTGYTIHRIARQIDAGEMLHQNYVPIRFKSRLSETISCTIADVWNASADGLCSLLNGWRSAQPIETTSSPGHYTTPSIWEFLSIWKYWKTLSKDSNRR